MIATPAKATMNPHRTSTRPRYPQNPLAAFSAMTSREVPTARFMGTRASSTSAGTIRKPPPTPTSPVSAPTARPSRATSARPPAEAARSSMCASRRPRSMNAAAASMTSANRVSCAAPLKAWDSRAPAYVPAIAKGANRAAVRHATFPSRQWLAAPTAAVAETTARLMAIAGLASIPST